MVLAPRWRLQIKNQSNATFTNAADIVIRGKRWKFVNGVYTPETDEFEIYSSAATFADDAYAESTEYANGSAEGWLGLFCTFSVICGASNVDEVIIYYQRATDDTFDHDDGAGTVVKQIACTASTTIDGDFSIN